MGEFPSGQRGQTVNLLAMPSMVRIHLPPPKIPITRLGGRYFSLRGRWSRSLSPSGEIHLPPPKIPITLFGWSVFFFVQKMESKFIPVRGNPSPPTKNTDYPFGWSVFFMPSHGGNGRAVRCLLLEEKVLSAARRMRWKGHDRLQCRR